MTELEQANERQASGQSRFSIDVLSIFPEVIDRYCELSLIGKARREQLIEIRVHDLRAGASDVHRSVDDAPFGGGAGMVLAPEPTFAAIELAQPARPLYLMSPAGERFDQARAAEMAQSGGFSLLCARYEGVDERIAEHLVDAEISVGDFVLAGGELAALVVIEAVARLLPGVLGNLDSVAEESFAHGLLEYPQYTRPASFRGLDVPEVLRSGDHRAIASWRLAASLWRTATRRPDLLALRGGLSLAEVRLLEEHGYRVQDAGFHLGDSEVPGARFSPAEERDQQ